MIVTLASRLATVAAMVAEDGQLDGAKIALFQNDIIPDEFTTWAMLTEATFTGYVRSTALVWGIPYVTAGTVAAVTPGSKQFNSTDVTVTNVVYGWAVIQDAGQVRVQYLERFEEPISMDGAGNSIIVQGTYYLPN